MKLSVSSKSSKIIRLKIADYKLQIEVLKNEQSGHRILNLLTFASSILNF